MENSSRALIATLLVTLVMLSAAVALSHPRAHQTRLASSSGKGTIKLGSEEFKLTSAVVKLLDNGKAEVIVVSEITVFMSGTWSRSGDASHHYDLTITGDEAGGGLNGSGSVDLSDDDKSVKRLAIKGTGKISNKAFEITFTGQ